MSVSRSTRYPAIDGSPLRVSVWPSVFDPKAHDYGDWSTPTPEETHQALAEWKVNLTELDLNQFQAFLDGQQLLQYKPWQPLFDFNATAQVAFLVVSGAYIRVIGNPGPNDQVTFCPSFQTITAGAILTPNALGGVGSPRTSEMCICVQEGAVIRINNPVVTLKSSDVLRALSVSRDADASWLRNALFESPRNEDRVKRLIEALSAWKQVDRIDVGRSVFRHPLSQSAIGEFLGISDNTLRPYLSGDGFDWLDGRLVLKDYFYRAIMAERAVGRTRDGH